MATHRALSMRQSPSSSSPPRSTFLFALFVFIFIHHVIALSGVIDKNAESLLKFKSALENSGGLRSWSASTTPCPANKTNWNGVLCLDGNVYGLQLENMGLSGKIDVDSLVPLNTLRILSFKNNNFQGSMPEWKKISALKAFYISNNHFSGEIVDDSFHGMSRLKKVDLGNNEFTGKIPSSLSSPFLLELKLENNKFSGSIPNFNQGIKTLNLSNNQLEGPIPKSLEKFDASSFSGNKGLCGKPMGSDCPTSKAKPSALKIAIIVICLLLVVALLVVILLAFLRSNNQKKYDSIIAQIYNHNPTSRTQQLEDPEADIVEFKKVEHNPNKLTFVLEERDNFDLHDLLRASAEVLGSGNFGSSFKATLSNGQAVVVKRFNHMNNVDKEEFLEHMRRIGRLQHPNLLPIVAYYYRKEEKLLVFDHVRNGSLASRLHGNPSAEKPSLDWPTRLRIIKGVAEALIYLQKQLPSLTVAHGHLKSSNIVLDKDLNPLLMDYSHNPVVNMEQVHHLLVSYKSPEYAQKGRITKKTDVWCLGILILEMLTGKIPTNYVVAQLAGYDSNLAMWIDSIVREDSLEVLDNQMKYTSNSKGEILKLLRIGAICCREDVIERVDLMEAVNMIEELKERDE